MKRASAKRAAARDVRDPVPDRHVECLRLHDGRCETPEEHLRVLAEGTRADAQWRAGVLTVRQERFVQEYLVCGNATRAAIAAGYSSKTAAQIGFENLRKPSIDDAVKSGRKKARERFESAAQRAIDVLERALESPVPGEGVRAAKDILDRAGYVPIEAEKPGQRTLEEIIADSYIETVEDRERVRVQALSLAALRHECRQLHRGRCASVAVHIQACAAQARASGATDVGADVDVDVLMPMARQSLAAIMKTGDVNAVLRAATAVLRAQPSGPGGSRREPWEDVLGKLEHELAQEDRDGVLRL